MIELNQALADAVAWWVKRKGLTQSVISANGGPSSTSLTKVLAGSGSVRPGSLSDLDVGLGWGEGVAVEYLNGRDPLGIYQPKDVPIQEWTNQQLIDELSRRLATATGEGGTDAGTADAGEKALWVVPDAADHRRRDPDHEGGGL